MVLADMPNCGDVMAEWGWPWCRGMWMVLGRAGGEEWVWEESDGWGKSGEREEWVLGREVLYWAM